MMVRAVKLMTLEGGTHAEQVERLEQCAADFKEAMAGGGGDAAATDATDSQQAESSAPASSGGAAPRPVGAEAAT